MRAFCVRNGLEQKLSFIIHRGSTIFGRNSDADVVLGGGGEEKVGAEKGMVEEKETEKGLTGQRGRRSSSREVVVLEMTSVGGKNEVEEDVIDVSLVNNPMLIL